MRELVAPDNSPIALEDRPTAQSIVSAIEPGDAAQVDACAYLFRFCRNMQRACEGIEYLFDVEPTQLPVTVCRVIAAIVAATVDDAVAAEPRASSGSVTLSLRRRGSEHVVLIADRGFRTHARENELTLASVRELAERIGGVCRISAASDWRIILVAFGIGAPRVKAATWDGPAAEARTPIQPIVSVLGRGGRPPRGPSIAAV